MEYSSVLAVWAVAVAGPCVISWLAGDLIGSARTRSLYAEANAVGETSNDAGHGDASDASAFRVEDWRVPGLVHPVAPDKEDGAAQPWRAPTLEEQAAGAERRRERRAKLVPRSPYEPMPGALAQRHADCSFDRPDAARILCRYEESVAALQRSNTLAAAHGHQASALDDAIRLTLAPTAPFPSRMRDLT